MGDLTLKMQEILTAQKENAFLSQKLARIITDLDISTLPDKPFAPGILNETYIEILKKYEFRSLIPMGHLAPKKELSQFEVKNIDSLLGLEKFELLIRDDHFKNPVIISTDTYGKIVIGFLGFIYSIDSKKVDVSEFIDFIIDSDIEVIGYDLKADLKQLFLIQKPLQTEVEGQARLF